jgi:hypothetical protein
MPSRMSFIVDSKTSFSRRCVVVSSETKTHKK